MEAFCGGQSHRSKPMGNMIGNTIKIDLNARTSMRAKFTRVAINIDLGTPVKSSIFIDDVA
ncbi:unnamed protein product [Dovyalis caffra]|uniref:Uncharacterized protein n=1 Tax=Dovyalis caffra TaxID=77055 RepID=A0AAV1SP33_9ROSI|nr:unnamed protein product [Dovyalis caffra]